MLTSRRQDQHLIDTDKKMFKMTCPQSQRRRYDATSEGVTRRGCDGEQRRKRRQQCCDVTGRRQSHQLWPTQLRYFIAIWFESYIVVSQALTLDKILDLNSMFLKVGK